MNDDLPPLPEPQWPEYGRERPYSDAYSKRQMREYARAAIAKSATVAAAQPKAEPVAQTLSMDVTLNQAACELLFAMVSPSTPDDPEYTEIRLQAGDGHDGLGLYVSQAEYPEEGSVKLCDLPAQQPQAEPVAFLWQHDETGRTTLTEAHEPSPGKRWHRIPLYTNPPQASEDAWRATVDDMLTVCHEVASDDPRESVNRLINWHVSVALDPAVSSDAAALVQLGREQASEDAKDAARYRWLRDKAPEKWATWADERDQEHCDASEVDAAIDAAMAQSDRREAEKKAK